MSEELDKDYIMVDRSKPSARMQMIVSVLTVLKDIAEDKTQDAHERINAAATFLAHINAENDRRIAGACGGHCK